MADWPARGGLVRRSLLAGLLLVAPVGAHAAPTLQLTGLEEPDLITNVGLSVPRITFSCQASTARLRRYLDSARQAAEEALQAHGYFNSRISARIEARDDCRDPALHVDKGPVTRVASVEIDLPEEIRAIEPIRAFVEASRPEIGIPLDQAAYDSLRDGLMTRVRQRGYLDARFTRHEIRVDPASRSAAIALQLEPGERYRFGKVTIEQSVLRDELAHRLTGVEPGAAYSSRDLLAMNQNLTGTEYFESVSVRPDLDARENAEVPVDRKSVV